MFGVDAGQLGISRTLGLVSGFGLAFATRPSEIASGATLGNGGIILLPAAVLGGHFAGHSLDSLVRHAARVMVKRRRHPQCG